MLDQLTGRLPLLIRLVNTGQFKKDLANAIKAVESGQGTLSDRLHDAVDANPKWCRSLLYHLFASLRIDGWYEPTADLIERDLARLLAAGLTEDALRGAFQSKLVNETQFEDVIYEIAAGGIFSQIFDPGTCRLEHPLDGSPVNPDLTGNWHGQRTRVEVKRIDDLPPRHEPQAEKIIMSAEIPGGFNVNLNIPLTRTSEAEFIKKMIEQLHPHRSLDRGGKVVVEGFEFTKGRPYLNTANHLSPISSIDFNDEPDFRHVQCGVFSGPTISSTEQQILDEAFPTPPGVTVFKNDQVNPSARLKSTQGERVYNDLKGKLRQCEDGAINIVVLGLSAPHYKERSLDEGLTGSTFATVKRDHDGGVSDLALSSTGLGPFTPKSSLANVPEGFDKRFPGLLSMTEVEIEQFQKVSGVLALRLSASYPLAVVRINPNATTPAPSDAVEVIQGLASPRVSCILE